MVHHLVTLRFLSLSQFHTGHQGAMITANCIEQSGWKPFHVLITFLIYCGKKWKQDRAPISYFHVTLWKLCSHSGPILGPISTTILKEYWSMQLPVILQTSISTIPPFLGDKTGVWRRLSVSVDVTHPSPPHTQNRAQLV